MHAGDVVYNHPSHTVYLASGCLQFKECCYIHFPSLLRSSLLKYFLLYQPGHSTSSYYFSLLYKSTSGSWDQ